MQETQNKAMNNVLPCELANKCYQCLKARRHCSQHNSKQQKLVVYLASQTSTVELQMHKATPNL